MLYILFHRSSPFYAIFVDRFFGNINKKFINFLRSTIRDPREMLEFSYHFLAHFDCFSFKNSVIFYVHGVSKTDLRDFSAGRNNTGSCEIGEILFSFLDEVTNRRENTVICTDRQRWEKRFSFFFFFRIYTEIDRVVN